MCTHPVPCEEDFLTQWTPSSEKKTKTSKQVKPENIRVGPKSLMKLKIYKTKTHMLRISKGSQVIFMNFSSLS